VIDAIPDRMKQVEPNQLRTSSSELVRLLKKALIATRGDKAAAARRLGWSRMRVYRVLQRESVSPISGTRKTVGVSPGSQCPSATAAQSSHPHHPP
jgi:DNA-binding NtrC family response regulator